jgi:hypothetical protein
MFVLIYLKQVNEGKGLDNLTKIIMGDLKYICGYCWSRCCYKTNVIWGSLMMSMGAFSLFGTKRSQKVSPYKD